MAWGHFELKAGGWVDYGDTAIPALIRVRFADSGGRLEIAELHLSSTSGALTGDLLRRLNPSRLEAAANSPDVADELRKRIARTPASTRHATERFLVALEPKDTETDEVASLPVSVILNKSKDRKRPDDFYREVAAAFTWLSRESDQPAVDLADANGVPPTTVHRWVKESRRRGLLPPTRRKGS